MVWYPGAFQGQRAGGWWWWWWHEQPVTCERHCNSFFCMFFFSFPSTCVWFMGAMGSGRALLAQADYDSFALPFFTNATIKAVRRMHGKWINFFFCWKKCKDDTFTVLLLILQLAWQYYESPSPIWQ
jgi:hypothetical protein